MAPEMREGKGGGERARADGREVSPPAQLTTTLILPPANILGTVDSPFIGPTRHQTTSKTKPMIYE